LDGKGVKISQRGDRSKTRQNEIDTKALELIIFIIYRRCKFSSGIRLRKEISKGITDYAPF
jgi:hypothetical protein